MGAPKPNESARNPLLPLLLSVALSFSLLAIPIPAQALNVTSVLSKHPDLSDFAALLASTGVASELSQRTSLTILAVPNSRLRRSAAATATPSSALADSLRYHVLLQYLSFADLRRTPPSGALVTTLLTTTDGDRFPSPLGSLNLTFDPTDGAAALHPPGNSSLSAAVLSLVSSSPPSLSVFAVDALLSPSPLGLMSSSESRPPSPGLNITAALLAGHDFNVAASMLSASGVVGELESDEGGAGVTLFVPTDGAFAGLPPSASLQSLPAGKKSLLLRFHVLHSYYPLGSLEGITNPMEPTLATEDNGAGSFTLNISRANGSVGINTGVVSAVVTQTVFDQKPVAIFGVSSVLLPREMFGAANVSLGAGEGAQAQPPEVGAAPESQPDVGPTHLSSPPFGRADVPPSFSSSSSSAGGALLHCWGNPSCLLSLSTCIPIPTAIFFFFLYLCLL